MAKRKLFMKRNKDAVATNTSYACSEDNDLQSTSNEGEIPAKSLKVTEKENKGKTMNETKDNNANPQPAIKKPAKKRHDSFKLDKKDVEVDEKNAGLDTNEDDKKDKPEELKPNESAEAEAPPKGESKNKRVVPNVDELPVMKRMAQDKETNETDIKLIRELVQHDLKCSAIPITRYRRLNPKAENPNEATVSNPNEATVPNSNEPAVVDTNEADLESAKEAAASNPKETSAANPKEAVASNPKETSAANPKEAVAAKPKEAAAAKPKEVTAAKPKEATAAKPKEVAAAKPKESAAAKPKGAAAANSKAPNLDGKVAQKHTKGSLGKSEEPKITARRISRPRSKNAKINSRTKFDLIVNKPDIEGIEADLQKIRELKYVPYENEK